MLARVSIVHTSPAGNFTCSRVFHAASAGVLALMSPIEINESQPPQSSDTPDQMGFSCDQCNLAYKHESSLKAHVWSSHITDGRSPFSCRVSFSGFSKSVKYS